MRGTSAGVKAAIGGRSLIPAGVSCASEAGGRARRLVVLAGEHAHSGGHFRQPLLTDAQQKTWKKIRAERRAELRTAYENRAKS